MRKLGRKNRPRVRDTFCSDPKIDGRAGWTVETNTRPRSPPKCPKSCYSNFLLQFFSQSA